MNPEKKGENIDEIQEPRESQEKIEVYNDEYKDTVAKFFEELRDESAKEGIFQVPDAKTISEYHQKDENSNFWVAMNEKNEIVGTVGVDNCGNGVGYLRRLYIRKNSRRKGIGGELLSTAVNFAKEKGYKTIFAATMPKNNRVHEFNVKNGFKKIETPPANPSKFLEGTVFFEMDLDKQTEQKRENIEEEPKEKIITYTDDYKDRVIKFFEEMGKEFPEIAGAKDVRNVPEWFQRDEASNFWMATDDKGEIIGTAGLRGCGNEIGYLSRMYVKNGFRGKGIGTRLLDARIKFAKEQGYKTIFAATMPENKRVHEFDIKHGFKRVEVPPPLGYPMTFNKGTVFFEMDLEQMSPEEKLEKSIEDCKKHYRGMIDVFKDEARKIEQTHNFPKGDTTEALGKTPYSRGLADGNKKIHRFIEEITSGSLSTAEAIDLLHQEIDRINKLI